MARRSSSRMAPRVASWSMATASVAKSSLSQPALLQAGAQGLGGVVRGKRREAGAVVDPGVEGAVAAHLEAVLEFREADQKQRQQRAAVPLVVEKDVQVVEGVLVQKVGLVEEEDGRGVGRWPGPRRGRRRRRRRRRRRPWGRDRGRGRAGGRSPCGRGWRCGSRSGGSPCGAGGGGA